MYVFHLVNLYILFRNKPSDFSSSPSWTVHSESYWTRCWCLDLGSVRQAATVAQCRKTEAVWVLGQMVLCSEWKPELVIRASDCGGWGCPHAGCQSQGGGEKAFRAPRTRNCLCCPCLGDCFCFVNAFICILFSYDTRHMENLKKMIQMSLVTFPHSWFPHLWNGRPPTCVSHILVQRRCQNVRKRAHRRYEVGHRAVGSSETSVTSKMPQGYWERYALDPRWGPWLAAPYVRGRLWSAACRALNGCHDFSARAQPVCFGQGGYCSFCVPVCCQLPSIMWPNKVSLTPYTAAWTCGEGWHVPMLYRRLYRKEVLWTSETCLFIYFFFFLSEMVENWHSRHGVWLPVAAIFKCQHILFN